MKTSSSSPSSGASSSGPSSPTLLFALLLSLVIGGGLVAWIVLRSSQPSAEPPKPVIEPPSAPPENPKPPSVEATGPAVSDADFRNAMKAAGKIPVVDRTGRVQEVLETHSLQGDVVDADSNEPVYYFWLYLIPPERGELAEASKSWTPSRFRNGHFDLPNQPAGIYNVLCESREHDPWTGQIKIPYDGSFKIRLKHGSEISGAVTDSNQTPVEGIDLQLVVDLDKIDGGANPPMQRMVKTDKMGRYAFNKMPPGTYGLKASLLSDELATEPEFRVDAGRKVVRDFTLPRMGTLKVVVKNIADQPVTRARVRLMQERSGLDRQVRTASSDIKGIARLDFIRDGNYKLTVVVQGFEPFEQPISVGAGDGFREVPVQLEVAQKSGR